MDTTDVSLNEKTVLLNLEFGQVSNRLKVKSDSDSINTEIDRKSLHIGVDLFDAPELRACQNFLAQLKAKVKTYCSPSFFRGGIYLVKLGAIETVNEIIQKAKVDFIPVVRAFADAVEKRRDESQERLKGEYDPDLYPSMEEVIEKFTIEHCWLSMSTPTSLKKISEDFFQTEKAKAEESLKSATSEITALLAAEAKSLGDHLIERLTPSVDGKPKQIRQSAVANISAFLDTFSFRDIESNADLKAQMDRVKTIIAGVDVKDLRMDADLRADLAKQFTEVTGALDKLVMDRPTRYMEKSNG